MMRWVRVLAVGTSLALSAVSCSGGGSSGGQQGGGAMVEGGILRIGSPSEIDSLNPFKSFEQDAYNAFMNIYPFLVQYDENLEFAPDFGTQW